MSLVSVIIPYYKKRQYILKTIKSVLRQSYKKIEIIIIYDDLFTEDLIYLKKIIKNNKKIKLYKNKKNFGAAKSRNIGIKYARGDYIALIDSDDTWKRNKVKLQLNFMKRNNLLFSYTAYKIIDENDRCIGIRKVKKFLEYKDLLKSCDIGLSTVIFHKNLKKIIFFPNLKTKEDYVVWLRLARNNIQLEGLSNQLTNWRKTKNSLSGSFFQKIIDGYKVYKVYERYNLVYSIYYLLILSYSFVINNIKKNFYT